MKKIAKGLLAMLLVICVAVSAMALTGILSAAQAIPQKVSIAFSGADNDWLTLNGSGAIQDQSLKLLVTNNSSSTIIIEKILFTGGTISGSGWTNKEVDPKGKESFAIAGSANNKQVLTATMYYKVKGNPDTTKETCSAYIYASNAETYKDSVCEGYIPVSTRHILGVQTTMTMTPVSTASLKYDDKNSDDKLQARNTVSIYIDKSKYPTWESFNLSLSLFNYVEENIPWYQAYKNNYYRDHAFFDKINLSQTSDTGSMDLNGYGSSPENKNFEAEYDYSANTGFLIQAGQNQTTKTSIKGTVPDEASSTFTLQLREFGQLGGAIGAVLDSKTAEMNPKWTITVYNNDKAALRDRLIELNNIGLNKDSYQSGWDAFEAALKNAYTVLGTIQVTAQQVQEALDALNLAYEGDGTAEHPGLVRFAVVYTNHYYYQGNDDSNPILIQQDIDLKVPNNEVYDKVKVLKNGDYSEYSFNRKHADDSKYISVETDPESPDYNNFTEVINQYYWSVNTEDIDAAIARRDNYTNEDTAHNPIYYDDVWEAYLAAYAEAVRVANNQNLYQKDIDEAYNALVSAEEALKAARVEVDVEWLAEGIEWGYQLKENAYDNDFGYGWDNAQLFSSNYAQSKRAAFLSAYDNAVEVMDKKDEMNRPTYTKAEADTVCAALWNAIGNLCVVDPQGVYLTNDRIRHADVEHYGYYINLRQQEYADNGLKVVFEDIIDNLSGNYQLHEEDFTGDSWYMLQDALYGDFAQGNYECAKTEESYPVADDIGELNVPAYSMINNIWFLASQADYNGCRNNLLDKVNNLEWIVDYTDLEDKVAEAAAIDLSEYTQSSITAFQEVYDDAAAKLEEVQAGEPQLYGDEDAITNAVMAQKVADLQAAIEGLRLRPKFTPNKEDVHFEPGIETPIYGETIGKTAQDVIDDLDIVNDAIDVDVNVYDLNNNVIARHDKVGTGYRIELYSKLDGEVFDIHSYVIKGDVIGDAQVTIADFALVFDHAFTENTLSGDFKDAADMNGDGVVDLCDAVMIQRIFS